MKKSKGFTLIELLAVIVILAVIALIATPLVMNVIDTAKKGAAEQSANGYMQAVEDNLALAMVQGSQVDLNNSAYDDTNVSIKGDSPKSVSLVLSNGIVKSGAITINGYTVIIADGKIDSSKTVAAK